MWYKANFLCNIVVFAVLFGKAVFRTPKGLYVLKLIGPENGTALHVATRNTFANLVRKIDAS